MFFIAMNLSSIREHVARALRVFTVHLTLSALIAGSAAYLVLGHWFVYPYHELLGGLHLFWLMVAVDVICGPLLTAIVWRPGKSRKALWLDVSVIALLQAAALGYGLYSLSLARPVALVYEVDRFVAVTMAQVSAEELAKAPPGYQSISLMHKPWLLGVRPPASGEEALRSIELSMQGMEPSVRPDWWQPYERSRAQVQTRMKPMAALRASPSQSQVLQKLDFLQTRSMDSVYFLPLVAKDKLDEWIVILDANASILGFAPVGGFVE